MNLTKPAKYISYLFIPPVMNFLVFIYFSLIFEKSPASHYGIAISFLFGLFLPVTAILYFRRKGILSNNDATIKEERTLPYIYAIFFSISGVVISALVNLDCRIIMLWMVYLVSSIMIININRFWKISAHAMGASMPVGAVYFSGDNFWLTISVILLFIIGFARLYLKVHSIMQVLAGSVLGFTAAFLLLNYCL